MRLQDAIWVNLIATRCRLLPSVLRISEKDPSIAGCSEVEPSSHGLVNACAAFPSEAHAAHRYAWVNNSATCCQLLATAGFPLTVVHLVAEPGVGPAIKRHGLTFDLRKGEAVLIHEELFGCFQCVLYKP